MTDAKRALRIERAERRAALHAERGWWAAQVAMANLPPIEGSGVVAGYWPMRSEFDPRPLMRRFAGAGWRIALPVTPARGVAAPLEFRLFRAEAELVAHAFGMWEPHPSATVVRPDVVIVPMLAFDRRGHRVGYGAGHYDRTLAGLRAERPVSAIGLAFAGQEVEEAPITATDQPLDAILTERAFTAFGRTDR